MILTTMSQLIEDEHGTFHDAAHETYLINEEELARSMVMLSSSRVYSFETGGGLMMDWVLMVEEDDD